MPNSGTCEVLVNYVPIKSSPSIFSSTLGRLNKGDLIDVISIDGIWAYFKYNNKDAYIFFAYLDSLQPPVSYGSLIVKYLDINTQRPISPDDKFTDLTLGDHNYSSKDIYGFNTIGDRNKSITLTEDIPNKTIAFEYTLNLDIINQNEIPYISTYYIKPIVSPNEEVIIDYYITDYYHKEYVSDNFSEVFTVTVKIDGKEDIILNDLKAGDHSVSLGKFTNEGEQKLSILCTDKYGRNSHELFNFFLVKNTLAIKEYIMTSQDLITYNIKNTDNYEEQIVVPLTLPTVNATTVKNALTQYASSYIPKPNTYTCFLPKTSDTDDPAIWWSSLFVKYSSDYNKDAVLAQAKSTREGLQNLLNDKARDGYNRVKLLPGKYRVDHTGRIYIPTNLTLDMNSSTIKLNQFTGNSAVILEINNCLDSHVINGTIEGDFYSHDYANSPNNSEWVNGIMIGGESKYSSFEDLILKDITGYGSSNGISNSQDGKLGYTYIYPRGIGNNFKIGDIDRKTGLDIVSTNRTTCDFRDISGYNDIGYLSISVYLGYQGNPCSTWNLICHFYDADKNYIKSIDAYQYRIVAVPSNSKYMRVTILSESYPTNLSIQLFRVPTHCSFKSIKHDNCRCVGMAPSAMNNMLFDSCEFTRSGWSSAKCAFDAEDGWDLMQDVTFRNLSFYNNPNNEFLTCAGHNFIVENQVNGNIYIWERTKDLVIRNSNIKNINLGFNENIVRHGVYRVYNNKIASGSINKNIGKNLTITNSLSGIIFNSTMTSISNDSVYTDCTININNSFLGYVSKIQMYNCKFVPNRDFTSSYRLSFNGGHDLSCVFKNCIFYGKSVLSNHNNFYSASFNSCTFDDTFIEPCVSANESDYISFVNCNISYSGKNLIKYSPNNYTKGIYTKVTMENCTIRNLVSGDTFAYAYAKPCKGYLQLNNCIVDIPNLTTFLDCYNAYLENIEDFTISLKNTTLNKNVKMLSAPLQNNKNIKVYIE